MKKIFKIARTELRTLFYSPVAWLILIIFTFQVSMSFVALMEGWIRYLAQGYEASGVSLALFVSDRGGLFSSVQQYLYLYIPLLTMGLMSTELNSGSIKLLYSSPVTNTQIILGKFLSMVIYGLILIVILMVYVAYGYFSIENFEIRGALSGILGLYLLICAYAAIGLFMSSLTSYQVVAAMGTLAMLAVLNYVGGMWQDIAFVRDITYWLSISGRAGWFINGLICSEDVLYFIIVVALFLTLAIVRLQANRQKSRWTVSWSKYLVVFCVAMLLGYISSRPALMTYYDATTTKVNTLTASSQDVIKRLKGGVTITSYSNALDDSHLWISVPRTVKYDMDRFRQYIRFKPEIKMKYVYYYDTIHNPSLVSRYPDMTDKERMEKIADIYDLKPKLFLSPEKIRQRIDLTREGNRYVRLLERESGEKTFLRVFDDVTVLPGETEITAAFKRLVMKLPKVGFLKGHGERGIRREGDRDYSQFAQEKPFRYALINQGFDIDEVTLEHGIPEDITILIVADMREGLTPAEKANLDDYIARGGNLLIAGEPNRQTYMNPVIESFGVRFVPGVIVSPNENYLANFTISTPTKKSEDLMYAFGSMLRYKQVVSMPSAVGIEHFADHGFETTPILVSDSITWNELETTNFIDDTVKLNSEIGEVQKSHITGLALTRKVGEKEQRIVVLGDADCISNGEIGASHKNVSSSNYTVIMGTFFWMSNNEVPIDVRRPPLVDNTIYVGKEGMEITKIIIMWIFPGLLLMCSILLWVRRRGR